MNIYKCKSFIKKMVQVNVQVKKILQYILDKKKSITAFIATIKYPVPGLNLNQVGIEPYFEI